MIRAAFALLALLLAVPPLAADEARLEGPMVQGGLVRGMVPAGTRVRLDGTAVRVSADGLFVIGFGRDAPPRASLEILFSDGTSETRSLEVAPRSYLLERIDGLAPNMVSPTTEELARIRTEAEWIAEARRRDTPKTWFAAGFAWPLKGRITGVYGSRRILNGEPRRPHFGVDIAAPMGAAVVAPGPGRVALAEPDLFFTGGTVIIDHGHGLTSVLSHLSSTAVAPGQQVRKGEVVGAVGATGRATGPHLDWRVNWFTARLDPALLVGPIGEE